MYVMLYTAVPNFFVLYIIITFSMIIILQGLAGISW